MQETPSRPSLPCKIKVLQKCVAVAMGGASTSKEARHVSMDLELFFLPRFHLLWLSYLVRKVHWCGFGTMIQDSGDTGVPRPPLKSPHVLPVMAGPQQQGSRVLDTEVLWILPTGVKGRGLGEDTHCTAGKEGTKLTGGQEVL